MPSGKFWYILKFENITSNSFFLSSFSFRSTICRAVAGSLAIRLGMNLGIKTFWCLLRRNGISGTPDKSLNRRALPSCLGQKSALPNPTMCCLSKWVVSHQQWTDAIMWGFSLQVLSLTFKYKACCFILGKTRVTWGKSTKKKRVIIFSAACEVWYPRDGSLNRTREIMTQNDAYGSSPFALHFSISFLHGVRIILH